MDAHPERVCDFCMAEDPAWIWPCDDFDFDDVMPDETVVPTGLKGAFAACDECNRMILLGFRRGAGYLRSRAIRIGERRILELFGEGLNHDDRRYAKRRVRKVHAGFWTYRKTKVSFKFG